MWAKAPPAMLIRRKLLIVPNLWRQAGSKPALPRSKPLAYRKLQKLTSCLIAAAVSAGTTLRATKSSQSLNFVFARASTMALDCAGVIFGSLSSWATVAVLRLILPVTAAVAAPVVDGLAVDMGLLAAGAGVVDGLVSCENAGADRSTRASVLNRTRCVAMDEFLS